MNKNINPTIAIGIILLVAIIVGGEVWISGKKEIPNPTLVQQNIVVQPSVPAETVPANWKTFTAKMEGFTIEYPADWKIEDTSDGNCGHTVLNGSECRDRYDFISPDGIIVRYVIFSDENNDRIGCGAQGECYADNVVGLYKGDVKNLGQVYLAKLNNKNKPYTPPFEVYLHKPLSKETTPIIGKNKYKDHMIFFSLPSKLGGRYALFLTADTADDGTTKFDNLTEEQFFNLDSVKKAMLMLKSINY